MTSAPMLCRCDVVCLGAPRAPSPHCSSSFEIEIEIEHPCISIWRVVWGLHLHLLASASASWLV